MRPMAQKDTLGALFDPALLVKLKTCGVTVLDDPVEVLPPALAFLGKNPTSLDPADLAKAGEAARAARGSWRYIHSSSYINDLATGEMKHIAPPADASLLGFSFMTRYGNDLVAIQTGFNPNRILRLHMSDDWSEVKSVDVALRSDTQLSQPTQGIMDGDTFVFVSKSQWDALDGQGNATKTPQNAVIAALKIVP